jgi:dephospho-CoA kinase
MKQVVVGVAGRMGSGKTTLAYELAARMSCGYASFGDYVRNVALERGLDSSQREVLQALGDELIATGWPPFCRAMLDFAGYVTGPVVVDGVRHVEAIEVLARIVYPLPFRLVAVHADGDVRAKRLQTRGMDATAAKRAEVHANESQVGAVLDRADYTIAGNLTIEEAADTAYRVVCGDLQA